MCEPMSMAMGAMNAAGSIAQGMGARRQASAQARHNFAMATWRNERYLQQVEYQQELADWQADAYYKTVASAQGSARGQYAAVLEQVELSKSKALHNIAAASRASQKGSSFVRASAAESGTEGSSVRLAQQQYELQEARHSYITYKNLETAVRNSERNLLNIQAQAQGRINQAMPPPMAPIDPVQPTQHVQSPSMLPYIIQGGAGIVNAMAWQQGMDADGVASGLMPPEDYWERWGGGPEE